jgi:cystathionine beta-lyase
MDLRQTGRAEPCGHLGAIGSIAAFREGGPWLDDVLAVLDHNGRPLSNLLAKRLPGIGYEPPQAIQENWSIRRRNKTDN